MTDLASDLRHLRQHVERFRLTPPVDSFADATRYPTPEEEAAAAARRWDSLNGQYPDGIKMDCWNKDEADRFKAEFKRLRPGVPVYVSWMEFR